ncbi:MAG: hypothetical protein KF773_05790 [Deltaproteobacteria bacterium]|nr:hypothetical protein [Deltaproteobacteria bacterium]MCW5808231.1 hypothetical protein [Deltaproteobacteria bacterium]
MADADDVLRKAGGFFSKLGGKLKDAGSQIKETTKHVTGLGRGDLRLEIDHTRVAPGGTLRGRLVLALSEPVEAKRLVVTLRARQKIMTVHRGKDGRSVSTSHADVYQFDNVLGHGKTYGSQTLPFELVIPPDALELRPSSSGASGNPVADAVRTVASALSPSAGPVEWEVIGRLEIAWGRDLSNDVDIIVAR